MNVIGERAFSMYSDSEGEKERRTTTKRDKLVPLILQRCARESSHECYCSSDLEALAVPIEEKHVTEILISSLNISNAEHILSLTQNYMVDWLALSEVSLKAFVAFLANTSNCAAEKARVRVALYEQLRLHPSCAAHMVPRYRSFMLLPDEDFAGITILEYVLSRLEQLVSVHNDVRISNTRTSRRRRRPTRMIDASPVKRPKKVEVFVDNEEAESNVAETAGDNQHPDVENLLMLLDYLTEVLRHDLCYTLKRGQPVHTCILAKLVLGKGDIAAGITLLNHSLVTHICEVLKNSETLLVSRAICELLELVGDVCALQATENNPNDGFDVEQLDPDSRTLVNELCAAVFGEKPAPAKAFLVVANLGPVWLRYHATRYLVERIFCRNVAFGMKGLTNVFKVIRKNIQSRILDTAKVLKLVNTNHQNGAAIGTVDGKKSVKSELNSYNEDKPGKLSSAKSETKSEIELRKYDDKDIEFNVRQKLSPFVCKLLFCFIDSSISVTKLTGTMNSFDTTEDSNNLKNILNELCGEKNIPTEFNILRRRLNKIL